MPACLGTMMVPFGHETWYTMVQSPVSDGGAQDRVALGGMLLIIVGASGAPGQAV